MPHLRPCCGAGADRLEQRAGPPSSAAERHKTAETAGGEAGVAAHAAPHTRSGAPGAPSKMAVLSASSRSAMAACFSTERMSARRVFR